MTKVFCDKCGKELDYWTYRKYNATYDIDMVWNEPHQSNPDGSMTLLYYISPGDIHMNLCGDCGSDLMNKIKEWAEKKENENT